jgi:hypothetical protein
MEAARCENVAAVCHPQSLYHNLIASFLLSYNTEFHYCHHKSPPIDECCSVSFLNPSVWIQGKYFIISHDHLVSNRSRLILLLIFAHSLLQRNFQSWNNVTGNQRINKLMEVVSDKCLPRPLPVIVHPSERRSAAALSMGGRMLWEQFRIQPTKYILTDRLFITPSHITIGRIHPIWELGNLMQMNIYGLKL